MSPAQDPEKEHREKLRKCLQVALTELVHAAHEAAEALNYLDIESNDAQRNARQALNHLNCAGANLRNVLKT
jgi:hypothetical protein